MHKTENKVLGSLFAAALGDAMGAVTENLTFDQIRTQYPGGVRTLIAPDKSAFAYGNLPGQITDDFSQTYLLAEEVVKNNGVITVECVEQMLIAWSNIPKYFNRFAGPTTRAAIRQLQLKVNNEEDTSTEVIDYARQATNGSAMKIASAGLFNPKNIDKAIDDAVLISKVTHDNQLAISGACAVAAAISEAFEDDATVYSVIQAGLEGAIKGEEIGLRTSRTVGGASVVKRTNLAISIALSDQSLEDKMRDIYDIVGTGLHISEAVPAAFGIILACNGDSWLSVCEAVNVGYDTDTVATIVGSIVGTLNGTDGLPMDWLDTVNERNEVNIQNLASDITKLIS